MAYLSFISDAELKAEVKHLIDTARNAQVQAQNKFGKNIIDPFSAMFEISGFGMNHDEWVVTETTRQSQKTLQNHIGAFHQKVLGKVINWQDMDTGSVIDLVNEHEKIIAEVKNKYNTISGGQLSKLYYTLEDQVMPKVSKYKGYTAYYAAIIPRKAIRSNQPFMPSDKDKGAKCAENSLIREIDGASFYELVTGDAGALEDLYDILPTVIEDVIGGNYQLQDKVLLKEYFSKAFG